MPPNMVDLNSEEYAAIEKVVKKEGIWKASMILQMTYPTLRKLVERHRKCLAFRTYDDLMPALVQWLQDNPEDPQGPLCACGQALEPDDGGECLACVTVRAHAAKFASTSSGRKTLLRALLDVA